MEGLTWSLRNTGQKSLKWETTSEIKNIAEGNFVSWSFCSFHLALVTNSDVSVWQPHHLIKAVRGLHTRFNLDFPLQHLTVAVSFTASERSHFQQKREQQPDFLKNRSGATFKKKTSDHMWVQQSRNQRARFLTLHTFTSSDRGWVLLPDRSTVHSRWRDAEGNFTAFVCSSTFGCNVTHSQSLCSPAPRCDGMPLQQRLKHLMSNSFMESGASWKYCWATAV